MANHKLWGGRFEASLEGWVEEFGASIGFDYRLAPYDLQGSLAHVKMLGQTGIIAPEEAAALSLKHTNLQDFQSISPCKAVQ